MNNLIPDIDKEMDDIANRIVIMWIENPDKNIGGMLFSLKSRVNRICNSVAEWSGDDGKLWRENIKMCNWSQENGKCPRQQQDKDDDPTIFCPKCSSGCWSASGNIRICNICDTKWEVQQKSKQGGE